MSQEISKETQVYIGDPAVEINKVMSLPDGFCNLTSVSFGTHTGTHCDAFNHFIENGKTIDRLSLAHFYGKALLIDLPIKNGIVYADELEKKLNFADGEEIAIIRTGFDKYLGRSEYFDEIPKFNKTIGNILKKHGIITVGFDFPSAETINGSRDMHKSILSREIVMIEGLVNLSEISTNRFIFSGFPINIKGSDGAPIRAVAII